MFQKVRNKSESQIEHNILDNKNSELKDTLYSHKSISQVLSDSPVIRHESFKEEITQQENHEKVNDNLDLDEINPDKPLSLDEFFAKLLKINESAPMPKQWNEHLVNHYSRPRGLQKSARVLFRSQSEVDFTQKYT